MGTGQRTGTHSVVTEAVCVLLLLGLCFAMLPGAALGDRPIGFDHNVHYFKTWLLRDRLLGNGHLYGWSHLWFAGTPVHYLYPFLSSLWILAVQALSLGWLSLAQAYGVGFFLFFFFQGYAVYVLGTRMAGRAVGLLAAVVCLTDGGSNFTGGWQWIVATGV